MLAEAGKQHWQRSLLLRRSEGAVANALARSSQRGANVRLCMQDIVPRFNERMVLSLASCPNCIMMDDELNVLPTSSLIKYVEPVPLGEDGQPLDDPCRTAAAELAELAEALADTQVCREGRGGGEEGGEWESCGDAGAPTSGAPPCSLAFGMDVPSMSKAAGCR